MDTAFFLLLLVPSVLSTESDSKGDRVTNVDSLHLGKCDINPMLVAMSAALAEQKVKIEHLQAQNQAQESRLIAAETLLQQQQLDLNAQADKLDSVKSSSAATEMQVNALTRDKTVSRVAFSAALVDSSKIFGPYNVQTKLVYKHVTSNIGNAYNSVTGIFSAPVKGVYHFEVYLYCGGDPAGEAYLMKNNEGTYMAREHQSAGFGTGANAIILLLEVGDVVYVNLPADRKIYDNEYHHNTFSGHLLFTV